MSLRQAECLCGYFSFEVGRVFVKKVMKEPKLYSRHLYLITTPQFLLHKQKESFVMKSLHIVLLKIV